MPTIKIIVLFFFVELTKSVNAQYKNLQFIYPIDKTPVITGNYGEIRPNHFHAGLDFSTHPTVNLPIVSVADGYVSRIKISSGGYGKVLYITHPNGYVSVYAHQKMYAQKIDTYIKQKQIALKKNDIELLLMPHELPVKKGEIIGYTGNSGSSTGPHLHFEIREEVSEIPINPLLVYNIKDDIKPTLTHIAIYNTEDSSNINLQVTAAINTKTNKLNMINSTFILKQNTFAIGFAGYDQANATPNKNNIYEAKVLLDGKLIYHHQLNTISFDNGRYVNFFSEAVNGTKFQKCFTPTCYVIKLYRNVINDGKIELKDTLKHIITVIVADEKGNLNSLNFNVKTLHITGYKNNVTKYNTLCYKETIIKKEVIECIVKAGSLTKSCNIIAYINKAGHFSVGDKRELLIKPITLSFKINSPIKGKEKQMVALIDDKCLLGTYNDGWFTTESKSFGVFKISYDTIAPKINLIKSKSNTNVIFKVSDNLSGIGDYHVYVNDNWTIAEYDAKTNTITCALNNATLKGLLHIKTEVYDKVGNVAFFKIDVQH